MTVSSQQFRVNFPEFASTTTYPNGQVEFWFGFAYNFLNSHRWGDSIDYGAQLFTAHNLALEARAGAESAAGGIPGGQVGPLSSKSVGPASASYDIGSGAEEKAGHWNLTTYGTRFIRLSKMMGAGPLFVGVGYDPDPLNGPAWPGPDTMPGFTNFGS